MDGNNKAFSPSVNHKEDHHDRDHCDLSGDEGKIMIIQWINIPFGSFSSVRKKNSQFCEPVLNMRSAGSSLIAVWLDCGPQTACLTASGPWLYQVCTAGDHVLQVKRERERERENSHWICSLLCSLWIMNRVLHLRDGDRINLFLLQQTSYFSFSSFSLSFWFRI